MKKGLRLFLMVTAIAIELFNPIAVHAITLQDLTDIHNLHTYFRASDTATTAPAPCTPTATPTDTPVAPVAAGKVFMIGDSITAGSITELTSAFTAAGFSTVDIDGLASRSLTTGSTGLNGLSVLQNDASRYADAGTIVIALGTNGGISDANIKTAITTINTNNTQTHNIYWVNVGVINSQRTSTGKSAIDFATINFTLTRDMTLGYRVIDWSGVVTAHPEYINPADGLGVHPTVAGRTAFASTVVAGINGGAVASTDGCASSSFVLSGADNAAKIFNFLVTQKGLTPVQAAGFMGNLQAEAHFDPKLVQYFQPMAHGGISQPPPKCNLLDFNDPVCHDDTLIVNGQSGYGIAQWTTSGRQQGLKDAAANAVPPSIPGDLGIQLNFLWTELTTTYNSNVLTPLKATTDLRTATDIVLKKFECPRPCVNLIQNPNPTTQAAYDKVLDQRYSLALGILTNLGSIGAP